MRRWWGIWGLVLGVGGCCSSAPVAPRPATPSVAAVAIELPLTAPTPLILDGQGLPKLPARTVAGVEGLTFRRLTESACLRLAAVNASGANMLDEENRVPSQPGNCETPSARLRASIRYH